MRDGARRTRAQTWSWLYRQLFGADDGTEATDAKTTDDSAGSAPADADGSGE